MPDEAESEKSVNLDAVTILQPPDPPENDGTIYRTIKLQNGVTALLSAGNQPDENGVIKTESYAEDNSIQYVSLAIDVGSYKDPLQYQGLSHFLEHIVLQGSKKFPKENGFKLFTTKYGGDVDALTDGEVTIFTLSVAANKLKEGLERLADMVIAPLLNVDNVRRERSAVDSEFRPYFEMNSARAAYILPILAKKDHPVTHFQCGNLQTLGGDPEELRAVMHEFWKKHYVARNMKLALRSSVHDLDTLQKWVVQAFESVPAGNVTKPVDVDESLKDPYDTDLFKKMFIVQPANYIKEVILTWSLPSIRDRLDSKPYLYVSRMIESERQGGIIHYLRERNWATGIDVDEPENSSVDNNYSFIFSAVVSLTDEGMEQLDEVTHAIFSFLKMLQQNGPDEIFFNELKEMHEMNFNTTWYFDAEAVTKNMRKYSPKNFLNGDVLLFKYDAEAISEFLSHMRHDNVNVIVMDSDYEGGFTHKERWLQTPYTVKDIPKNWTISWETAIPLDSFTMPKSNPYLATDFEIYNTNGTESFPRLIKKTEIGELWLKKEGWSSKAAIFVQLLSAVMIFTSPPNACMLDVMAAAWNNNLATEGGLARAAGLELTLGVDRNGIELHIGGYYQKLPMLFEKVLLGWEEIETNLDEHNFVKMKNTTLVKYLNEILDSNEAMSDIEGTLLELNHISINEKYKELEEISLDQFKMFLKRLRRRMSYKLFISGNMREDQAVDIKKALEDFLQAKPMITGTSRMNRRAQLPNGETFVIAQAARRDCSNSVYNKNLFCGLSSMRHVVIADIIESNLHHASYDYLRTKQQLAYTLSAVKSVTNSVLGLTISLNYQEDKNNLSTIDKHVQILVQDFYHGLKNASKEQFELMKTAAKLFIYGRTNEWAEIKSNEHFFKRSYVEIVTMDLITQNETIDWFEKCAVDNTHTRILTTVLQGRVEKEEDNFLSDKKKIAKPFNLMNPPGDISRGLHVVKDFDEFRKTLFFYPQRTPGN